MSTFTGTGALVRLALRRDRIKLPIWIVAIVGLLAMAVPALGEVYSTAEERTVYAATLAPSVVTRALGGPIDGPDLGSIFMIEYFLFAAVLMAFMNTLAVVRHTRQNEEAGRSELIGAGVVSRHASLTAALIVAGGASLMVAVLAGLILSANQLPAGGAWAVGLALGGVGVCFAGVAAVTAQLSSSARAASSLAAAAIGAAFLARAIGDATGRVADSGLSSVSAWPSWLSPIGWGQQMHPFAGTQWWILSLFGATAVMLVALAFALTARRDLGQGLLPDRLGPRHAATTLLSPLGLAWRLQRGVFIGWAITVLVLGVTTGSIGNEFTKLVESNDQLKAALAGIGGGSGNISDVFFAAMMSMMGLTIAAYAVQALLRLRTEEADGRLEGLLATSVGRSHWMLSHVSCVLAGAGALGVGAGVSTALTFILVTGAEWSRLGPITAGALVPLPAVLALCGLVVLVVGWWPRLAFAASWGAFTFCIIIMQLGALLKLPDWIIDLSPFSHIPSYPGENLVAAPLLTLAAIGLGLVVAGLAAFRHRSIITS